MQGSKGQWCLAALAAIYTASTAMTQPFSTPVVNHHFESTVFPNFFKGKKQFPVFCFSFSVEMSRSLVAAKQLQATSALQFTTAVLEKLKVVSESIILQT